MLISRVDSIMDNRAQGVRSLRSIIHDATILPSEQRQNKSTEQVVLYHLIRILIVVIWCTVMYVHCIIAILL